MKFLKGVSLLTAVSIMISGCVPTPTKIKNNLAKVPEPDRAYIIGKFTVQCDNSLKKCHQGFNSISAWYQDIPNKESYDLIGSTVGSIFGRDTEFDFISKDDEEQGFFFCEAIPEGDYAFYSFQYYDFAGGGSGFSVDEESHFKLPFSVSKSEVAYIGQLKMTLSSGKNTFGMKVYGPGILQLSSDPKNDIKRAIRKCPISIQEKQVVDKSLNANKANSPLVQNITAN